MRQRQAISIGVLVLLGVMLLSSIWLWQTDSGRESLTYSQVQQLFRQERVESFTVAGNVLTLHLNRPLDGETTVLYTLYDFDVFYNDMHELVEAQKEAGIIDTFDYQADQSFPWLETLLPALILAGTTIFMIWFLSSHMPMGGGGGPERLSRFGSIHVRRLSDAERTVSFLDVAGADEEKEELQEIVDFLRFPQKYRNLGARIPKGVLLSGPPGTGKTLLARAVAGEAGVAFLSISGSDFVELYVGIGASRVRDLFEQAKRQAPAIVFIDEIDAVGRQRGAGLGGGHDEREQTLNQLLVEMDGFAVNTGVVVMAATNRADVLDPALLRPGRFDRRIYVGLPDVRGREEILKIHTRNKPLAEDVDLAGIARGTAGFTGADLENLANEAALLAARNGQDRITMECLKESELKVIAGPEKRSRIIPQHERELAAWHEAGHAVVMHCLPDQDPVSQISIVPRGQAGGMTVSLPEEDRFCLSRSYLENQIVSLLGGRTAEKLALGDISTGAASDIQRATRIARKMVATYGMSERIGAVSFESGHDEVFLGRTMGQGRSCSEQVAAEIDEEVKILTDRAGSRCEALLRRHRPQLDAVARFLLDHETMTREDFLAVFRLEGEAVSDGADSDADDTGDSLKPVFDFDFGSGFDSKSGADPGAGSPGAGPAS